MCFQYHLNCLSNRVMDWILSNWIKSEDCICWLDVEIRSNQLQLTEFVTYLDAIKERESVFSISPQLSGYYWQMSWYWSLSNRINPEDCICWLAVEIRSNQLKSTDIVTYLVELRKRKSIFNITSIVRIFLTNEVILKFF